MPTIKVVKLLMITLLLSVVTGSALADGDGKMTDEERAKVIKYLKDSHAQTLATLERLSDQQLKFKAAPEKWSVIEVAEHIMLAEGLLFGATERALATKPNPEWEEKTKGKTEFLEKVMLNRQGKAQAPESIVPTGKLSRAEVIAKLNEKHAEILKFAQETQLPLKAYTLDHPFKIFGTLNAYQWLIYVPLHTMRHNLQIDEVKADANFPKK